MAKYRANDPRPELKPLLRKWDGNPAVNRATDAPHIKTYLRYREVPGETGERSCYSTVEGHRGRCTLW